MALDKHSKHRLGRTLSSALGVVVTACVCLGCGSKVCVDGKAEKGWLPERWKAHASAVPDAATVCKDRTDALVFCFEKGTYKQAFEATTRHLQVGGWQPESTMKDAMQKESPAGHMSRGKEWVFLSQLDRQGDACVMAELTQQP